MKDMVLPNTSQVKFKKTEVEDHPRISCISNQTKSATTCNESLSSRTSNVNVVCATCGKCVFNSIICLCFEFLNDVNPRTKKPNVVPISTRKPKSQANKSVAIPHKKIVASESTTTNSNNFLISTSSTINFAFQEDVVELVYQTTEVLSRGTEFLNKTLNAFFKEEGIKHQTSTPRTPEQNGVVERQNRTLIEAARTMLSASKLPLFFWAEAIATTCYTQNRIIIPTHEKRHITSLMTKNPQLNTFTSLVAVVT
ncbi:retrovirus-related pol polyprotein from transposon TNT 1-94 [Tanacetum coccineum]